MDEFQMIKNTIASIKEYVSMRSSFPNESDRNNVIRNFNIQFIGKERKKVISIEIANYLKLENRIFNKYIEEVANELHIKLEGLHKVNSVTSEADAYYIYLWQ